MGLPLGPTISEFYMFHIENKIFKRIITKPKIYVRYVDIFIATETYDEISKLKNKLSGKKKLRTINITTELNINTKYPFPCCTDWLHW